MSDLNESERQTRAQLKRVAQRDERIAELDEEVFKLSDALDDKNKRIAGLEEYARYRESKALKLYDRIAELEAVRAAAIAYEEERYHDTWRALKDALQEVSDESD